MSYKNKLSNIDATVNTSNKVATMRVPWVLIVFLIVVVALIVFILWKFGNTLGEWWTSITSPITDAREIGDAQARTGTNVTIDGTEAQRIADAVYGTFSWHGDSEESLKSIVLSIATPADWDLVLARFGSRYCGKVLCFCHHTMPEYIAQHAPESDKTVMRAYLMSIGVSNPGF